MSQKNKKDTLPAGTQQTEAAAPAVPEQPAEPITGPDLPGIHIKVNLSPDTFRKFALYDTFVKQKRFMLPFGFAAIMLFFSLIAFLAKGKDQHIMIGCLLLIVGLALPLSYWFNYMSSLKAAIKNNKLPRDVYELRLTDEEDGIKIHSLGVSNEQASFKWADTFGAVRAKDCIYLYIFPIRAFLLPDGQADVTPDELWAFLEKHYPAEKLRVLKK